MVRILDDWNGEERAVSPVIGVILMVAITVILAAVIGTFVLDLGQNVQNTGPSASMGFSDADATWEGAGALEDFIVIEHQSGEALDGDAFRIVVRNVSSNQIVAEYDNGDISGGTDANGDIDNADVHFELNSQTLASGDTVNVGDTITVQVDEGAVSHSSGYDYSVTVVSTETDNRIGTGTIEVN